MATGTGRHVQGKAASNGRCLCLLVPRAPEKLGMGLGYYKRVILTLNDLGSSINPAPQPCLHPDLSNPCWSRSHLLPAEPQCTSGLSSSGCGSLGTSQGPSPDSTRLFQRHKRKAALFLQHGVGSAPLWITALLLQLPEGSGQAHRPSSCSPEAALPVLRSTSHFKRR